jgi:SWI/SNF-related matrix-associated actin-dependent regulator 1 of chromatin subfamily A
MVPFPHQVSGAAFLAAADTALLGDEPRVGKTGAAILAADQENLKNILVITTASGRAVWEKAFADWSPKRSAAIYTGGPVPAHDNLIISWAMLQRPASLAPLLKRTWDVIISDEDHYAKSFTSKRTQSLYGRLVSGGANLDQLRSLSVRARRLWCLTGTPIPHSPADMYPRLRALRPEILLADRRRGWPDVTKYDDFLHRYCIVRMKKISNWNSIPVVVGGRNEQELRDRIGGWMLRRTQADVGIREPIYELLPLLVDGAERRALERELVGAESEIMAAINEGKTDHLDMHLGPLRRLTGKIKAPAIVQAAVDEFDTGLDKLVIAFWHHDVAEVLVDGLTKSGLEVTGIDGSTPAKRRSENLKHFSYGSAQVFLAQIEAAGEAIDLSAASTLWFAETTFSPRAMRQMSLRITNLNQQRQAFVKVCTLAHSIDEAVQGRLLMLWSTIRRVLNVTNGD